MARQLNCVSTYLINYEGYSVAVTMEGLKNDYNGNRRFKAFLSVLSGRGLSLLKDGEALTRVYTFRGHCLSEKQEAERLAHDVIDTFKKG